MKVFALMLIAGAVLVIGACAGQTAPSSPSIASPSVAIPANAGAGSSQCPWSDIYRRCLPAVDPSIEPISLKHPSAEAAAALERCLAGRSDIEVVAGGRIARARDAWEYVPVPRNQLELQSDEPTWLIQLRGEFIFPTPNGAAPGAGVWHDPLCLVRRGESGYIAVSDSDASSITRALPPPTP